MLHRYSTKVQALLDKAALAREYAERAVLPEDKQFWLDMEAKWLALVRSTQQVERASDYLASRD